MVVTVVDNASLNISLRWYHMFDIFMYKLFLVVIKENCLLETEEFWKVKAQLQVVHCNYFQLPKTFHLFFWLFKDKKWHNSKSDTPILEHFKSTETEIFTSAYIFLNSFKTLQQISDTKVHRLSSHTHPLW
jgi:hypothetical protein